MTKVMSMQKVKVKGQRSRVTEVKTQCVRFRAVTQIGIHRWLRNDAYNIVEVPYCFSTSSVKFQGHRRQKSSNSTQFERFPNIYVSCLLNFDYNHVVNVRFTQCASFSFYMHTF